MNLEARIDRLESIRAIRELPAAYGRCIDARDIDALVSLYVEEVRPALMAGMVPALKRVRMTILFTGTHVIDFDDATHARGLLYSHAEVQNTKENFIHQAIWYSDDYERRDGRWLFARPRRHELLYGVTVGKRPQELPPADWPTNDVGTGTVPYRFESWQQFWATSGS